MDRDLNQQKTPSLLNKLEQEIKAAVTAKQNKITTAVFSALPTLPELKELVKGKISAQNETNETHIDFDELYNMSIPMKRTNGFSEDGGWIENISIDQALTEALTPFYLAFSTALRKKIETEVIKSMLKKA